MADETNATAFIVLANCFAKINKTRRGLKYYNN